MSERHIPALSVSRGSDSGHSASAAEVRDELQRVLNSQEFRSSRRSQEFLKYVVENTLAGKADSLKERTIGIEVYGRSADYVPSDDATVRVKAGEVRKRLEQYYSSDGHAARVRIEIRAGSYVPEFRTIGAPEAPERSWVWHSVVWILAVLIVVAVTVASVWLLRPKRADTAVDRFWQPVLQGSTPLLITTAFVPVYNIQRGSGEPNGDRFVLLTDQFIGGGDLMAASRIMQMLARMNRTWQTRIGSEVTFADLRSGPTVLIGYSYTRWKEISRQMRFFIDADRLPRMITDNGKPTPWSLPHLPPDNRTDQDYAIVSRVFHPETGAMLVEISGITQYGTAAAAELATSPELLADALRGAPPNWKQKNLQFVVHVNVIGGTPGKPSTVATYFW